VEFEDALGWLIEYDYSFSGWQRGGFVLGIRYLRIDYKVEKVDGIRVPGGFEFDGNHVGAHVDFMFRRGCEAFLHTSPGKRQRL